MRKSGPPRGNAIVPDPFDSLYWQRSSKRLAKAYHSQFSCAANDGSSRLNVAPGSSTWGLQAGVVGCTRPCRNSVDVLVIAEPLSTDRNDRPTAHRTNRP